MNYFSTRDKSLKFSFKDIFLRGLAPGGGLFLPSKLKKYSKEDLNHLSQLNYNELATEIIYNFCSDEINKKELNSLIKKSYISFKEKEVVNEINTQNKNSLFLEGIELEKNIYATDNISEAIAPFIFYVTPAQHFRKIVSLQKKYIDEKSELIICSKGIIISLKI